MYTCPVCGYERLAEPPMNFTICPCCGTEFEYDDYGTPYAELRRRWILNGFRWFSPVDPQPNNWNPVRQLLNLQFVQPPSATLHETILRTRLGALGSGPSANPSISYFANMLMNRSFATYSYGAASPGVSNAGR